MSVTVEGFALHKVAGRKCDMWILSRQGREGAGQRLGLFSTASMAWRRARRIRDKEFMSVMVPGSRGTSDRLVRRP